MSDSISRRAILAGAAAAARALAARPAGAQTASTVTVGFLGTSSDIPLLVADKLGYFKEAGIGAKFTIFDGATRMVAPTVRSNSTSAADRRRSVFTTRSRRTSICVWLPTKRPYRRGTGSAR